jgi:alpha-glucosidase
MQWDGSPTGGFTSGDPWLPAIDPARRNVAGQRGDPASLLSLYRELIALRPRLGRGLRTRDSADGVLSYVRGRHLVAINTHPEPRPAPTGGDLVLETEPGALRDGALGPHRGAILALG